MNQNTIWSALSEQKNRCSFITHKANDVNRHKGIKAKGIVAAEKEKLDRKSQSIIFKGSSRGKDYAKVQPD